MTDKQSPSLSIPPQDRLKLRGSLSKILYTDDSGTEQIGLLSGTTEAGIYWQQGPYLREEWFRTMSLALRRMADVMEGKVPFEEFDPTARKKK